MEESNTNLLLDNSIFEINDRETFMILENCVINNSVLVINDKIKTICFKNCSFYGVTGLSTDNVTKLFLDNVKMSVDSNIIQYSNDNKNYTKTLGFEEFLIEGSVYERH